MINLLVDSLLQGLVEGYLMVAARRSNLFAHILIWQLQVSLSLSSCSLFNRSIMNCFFLSCIHFTLVHFTLQGEEPPSSEDIKEEHAVEVCTPISLVVD